MGGIELHPINLPGKGLIIYIIKLYTQIYTQKKLLGNFKYLYI